jgi:hypothetical protein
MGTAGRCLFIAPDISTFVNIVCGRTRHGHSTGVGRIDGGFEKGQSRTDTGIVMSNSGQSHRGQLLLPKGVSDIVP